jgi:hypothetical protein
LKAMKSEVVAAQSAVQSMMRPIRLYGIFIGEVIVMMREVGALSFCGWEEISIKSLKRGDRVWRLDFCALTFGQINDLVDLGDCEFLFCPAGPVNFD